MPYLTIRCVQSLMSSSQNSWCLECHGWSTPIKERSFSLNWFKSSTFCWKSSRQRQCHIDPSWTVEWRDWIALWLKCCPSSVMTEIWVGIDIFHSWSAPKACPGLTVLAAAQICSCWGETSPYQSIYGMEHSTSNHQCPVKYVKWVQGVTWDNFDIA